MFPCANSAVSVAVGLAFNGVLSLLDLPTGRRNVGALLFLFAARKINLNGDCISYL